MRKLLATLAVILLAAPGISRVGAAEVTVDLFYRSLEPHGEWVETADYGYVWSPKGVAEDWRPYTVGQWAFTDAGWTWVSEEPFGWATYHYGRWVRVESSGWVWVPDTEWAPAWVSWRRSPKHVGWAPLPPEARFRKSVGIKNWSDSYYDVGPEYYSFVEVRQFGSPRLARLVVPPRDNVTIIRETKNITNITVVNNYVYNGGPDYEVIVRETAEPVRRLRIERRMDIAFEPNVVREETLRTTVTGDTLRIIAPDIRFASEARPARVARRLDRVQVDRGWRVPNVEQRQVEQLRAEIKKESPQPPAELPPQPKFDRTRAVADASNDKSRPERAAQQTEDSERLSVPGTPGTATQSGATVGTPSTNDRMPGRRPGREGQTSTANQSGTAQPDAAKGSATAPGATSGATTATPPANETPAGQGSDRANRGDRMNRQQPGAARTEPLDPEQSATKPDEDSKTPATPAAGSDATKRKAVEQDRPNRRGREQSATTPPTTTTETPSADDARSERSGRDNGRKMRQDRNGREQPGILGEAASPSTSSTAKPGETSGASGTVTTPANDSGVNNKSKGDDKDRPNKRERSDRKPSDAPAADAGTAGATPGAATPEAEQPRRGRGDRAADKPSSGRSQDSERSPDAATPGERPPAARERRGPSEENARPGRGDRPERPEPGERPERTGRPERGSAQPETSAPDRGPGGRSAERPQARPSAPEGGNADRAGRPERGNAGERPQAAGERGGTGRRGAAEREEGASGR